MPFVSDKRVDAIVDAAAVSLRKQLTSLKYPDNDQIKSWGYALLHIANSYSRPTREKFTETSPMDKVLFAFAYARFPATTRQHQIYIS